MATVRVRAHAKINLSLRVLGRRSDDGYHDLRTVFQALALHDTLECVGRPGPLTIESDDSRVPVDESNLAWRAATLLWQHLGRPGNPADTLIRIDKRIPMKGGLGGGSSDGAAALAGLARLWDADVPATDLQAIGRRLGADVGFFFTGGAALGLARGDELYPLPDLPRFGVLLVVPGFDVSTADAYRWVDQQRERTGEGGDRRDPERANGAARPRADAGDCSEVPVAGHVLTPAAQWIPGCTWAPPACEIANDFEEVVAARYPEVVLITQALRDAGARAAAMSGSGSTIFGLFEDDVALGAAASALTRFGQPIVSRTLGRAEYLESATPFDA